MFRYIEWKLKEMFYVTVFLYETLLIFTIFRKLMKLCVGNTTAICAESGIGEPSLNTGLVCFIHLRVYVLNSRVDWALYSLQWQPVKEKVYSKFKS